MEASARRAGRCRLVLPLRPAPSGRLYRMQTIIITVMSHLLPHCTNVASTVSAIYHYMLRGVGGRSVAGGGVHETVCGCRGNFGATAGRLGTKRRHRASDPS